MNIRAQGNLGGALARGWGGGHNWLFAPGVMISGGTYKTADDSSQVEDAPEPGEVMALLVLNWVRDHDGALGSPKQAGTDAEPHAGKDVKAEDRGMN